MKIGDMKDFRESHPFIQKLLSQGEHLNTGLNMLNHKCIFLKFQNFYFSLSWQDNSRIVAVERIARSEKFIFMGEEFNEANS